MTTELILLISAAAVFTFLVFLYILVASESKKRDRRYMTKLYKSYSKETLRKMEYDIAFYDKKIEWFLNGGDDNVQVTIDDILKENKGITANKNAEIFVHIENEGLEEIQGHYRPEGDK